MSIRSNMDSRRLDQRVTFQRDTGTADSTGDVKPSWANIVANVPAAVDGTRGREFGAVDGVRAEGAYTVWVQADIVTRFSIAAKDRIVWGSRVLNIVDAPDQQLGARFMALDCRVGVNAG